MGLRSNHSSLFSIHYDFACHLKLCQPVVRRLCLFYGFLNKERVIRLLLFSFFTQFFKACPYFATRTWSARLTIRIDFSRPIGQQKSIRMIPPSDEALQLRDVHSRLARMSFSEAVRTVRQAPLNLHLYSGSRWMVLIVLAFGVCSYFYHHFVTDLFYSVRIFLWMMKVFSQLVVEHNLQGT